VLLGLFGPFGTFFAFKALGFWTSFETIQPIHPITATSFLLLFLWPFLRLKSFKKMNITIIGYLYVVTICASYYMVGNWNTEPFNVMLGSRINAEADSLKYVPWFMAPPKTVATIVISIHPNAKPLAMGRP
jgi:hypothetical protein